LKTKISHSSAFCNSPFHSWGLRIGWLLFIMLLTRMVFLASNANDFNELKLTDWLAGTWFDLITLALISLPFLAISLLPFSIQNKRFFKGIQGVFFITLNVFVLFFNLVDVEYYRFTKKRSTIDLFEMVQGGNDITEQIGSYFKDFWFVMLVFIGFIWISNWFYKKTKLENYTPSNRIVAWIGYVLSLGLLVFIGRGGWVLKPVSPIDASQFTSVENTAFVLNTPFTIIKSFNKKGLEEKHYFSEAEERKLFTPIKTSQPQNLLPAKTNVMIIILESFGNEWVGASGAKISYTPFLDSLAKQSLFFPHGISNGKKSIEAMPAIFASIPSLMDNPYISSQYGNNRIEALPQILKKQGYSSAFFHGATNGSMKFDGFASQAGIEKYFGRSEYNNETHYDHNWGILDEYFNPWTAKQLTTLKQPFVAGLFTLSSHHPFYIPPHMKGKLKKGKEPICEAIHYADYSLAQFFKMAKKQPWFKNTLFVLCADHTPASNNPVFNTREQMYQIPIVFYHPQGFVKPKKEKQVFQQIDIFPTVLDLLNVKTNYYSFGNSYYQKTNNEGINYLEGTYQYFKNGKMLTFSQEKARNLISIETRSKKSVDSLRFYPKEVKKMERRLKAIIQRYNRDLIHNQTTAYEKKHLLHH
jgi:phosphoglycerol transferase MdoB-like AlkP superfamily enzyme